ncbi:esterase [Mycobacterium tuberculosis]|uniref:esterase n=1 Tax=Mycobacterium tuberculosis TaxID=1773 RepID=UPI0005DF7B72|nr:esterase [Mycobacterium tuberculosis]CFD70585.1 esterase [Mycobacterium tuberculosis]CFG68341.1 esterase [Mycobacterium tuberculosis]CMJ39424.1 esterase [Mycobacterium tuberculosis]CMO78756.1 esterase [Mycobacterium tuberculosis]CMQ79088.1 esterase [Mycobacterium tuberculosis]
MVSTHAVVAGETLSALALRFYGDAELYRLIAAASGIADPDVVNVGQRLIMPDFTRYTVVAGDTLSALALRFYGDAELYRLIAAASGIADPDVVNVGQRLIMPDFTRYTVVAGDTLSALAARFYGDASLYPLIAAVNGIADPGVIDVGQVLVIFIGRSDGFGLRIVDRNENDPRLWYYRFQTSAIGWNPGVNVLLPDDYRTSGRTYPVLYLFHGGGTDQDFRTFDFLGIRDLTAGKPIIIVMPDGGHAGWYSNPVSSFVGPRNWERFHIAQLLPWIEANFRTYAEYDGRAVAGFSMGGFGALKYAAKYYGHFASASSHSGPASLRRDFGLVVHWANLSSAVLDLGGGTVYGAPLWDQARVSADNPVERIDSYRNKRIFLVAGTSPDPANWFDSVNETQVLAGQREFRERLSNAGIPHESHEVPGGHVFRPDMFRLDLDGIVARLRPASIGAAAERAD